MRSIPDFNRIENSLRCRESAGVHSVEAVVSSYSERWISRFCIAAVINHSKE